MMSQQPCFCGGGDSYSLCVAHFPEQLMRSRYSAYHEQEVDYLIMTTHPSKRHLQDRYELAESVKQTEWLGLKIIKSKPVAEAETVGHVEFVAFFRKTNVEQLHEVSEFVKENNRWYWRNNRCPTSWLRIIRIKTDGCS